MPFKLPVRLDKLSARTLINEVDNFLFDCDGVIWNWPKVIDGSVDCINKLKELGKRCYFVTNNSTKTRETVLDMINKVGIKNVTENDIVCTAWILAGYLKSINFTDKVYVVGNKSMAHELDKENIKHIGIGPNSHIYPDPANCDYKSLIKLDPNVRCVVVGFDYYFNYPKMVEATSYVHKMPNCLFIGTNDDSTLPTSESNVVIPGTGTFVNAIKTSAGRPPILLGKPYRTMWDTLAKLHNLDPKRSCMIGDRLDTDIAFAANCSLGFSLAVLSGVTNEPQILEYSNKMQSANYNEEDAKCAPDYYTDSLNQVKGFIADL